VEGWWQPEQDRAAIGRWTNGNAALPAWSGSAVVEVWIGATLPYPVAESYQEKARAAA